MKKANFFFKDYPYWFRMNSFQVNVFICMLFFLILISACAGKMSMEEAKQVTVSMNGKSLVAPPRKIDDVLAAIGQTDQSYNEISKKLRAEITKPPPQTENAESLAKYYRNRGRAAIHLGYFSQALADLRLALEYSSRTKTGGDDTGLLVMLASMEQNCGNFKRSIELLDRALRFEETPLIYQFLVKHHALAGDLNLASKYKNLGVNVCKRFIAASRWRNWPYISAAWMNIYVLEAQGKFAEAEPYYRRIFEKSTRSIIKEAPGRYTTAKNFFVINLMKQNRLIEAELEVRDTLKVLNALGKDSMILGSTLGGLGEILLRQGRLQDAEILIRKGFEIIEEANVSSASYIVALTQMRLGEVLAAQEKFDEAVKYFDLASSEMQHNQNLYKIRLARNPSLILALLRTGRIKEATKRISTVYAQNKRLLGEEHYLTREVLGFRGMVYAIQDHKNEALQDFSEASKILFTPSNGDIASYDSKIRRKLIAESYIELLAKVRGTELEKTVGIDTASESLKIADALSGSTVRGAIRDSTSRTAVTSPELSDLVRKEQDAQKQLKVYEIALVNNLTMPIDQQNEKFIKELSAKIDTLRRARIVLVDEIKIRFPKYAEFANPKPVTISYLKNYLHPEDAFISIYTTADKSYVWAIPHEGKAIFTTVPLGQKPLSKIVTDLRKSLDPKPVILGDIPAFDTQKAYDLYRAFLIPVWKGWKEAKNLLIVANGPLGQLPFAILPTASVHTIAEKQVLFSRYKNVPWLIRRASITRLPSASTFVNLRTIGKGDPLRKSFAGFGDPIFNQQQLAEGQEEKIIVAEVDRERYLHVRGVRLSKAGTLDSENIVSCTINNLNRLPDTSDEIKQIAMVLGVDLADNVFLGKQASEQQVKSMDLSDRRVIAFATHALVPGDLDGLDQPALALSSPSISGDDEDGLLTMGEILRLKLNADWVVLSACNTGAAEGQGAEAISGLGRAFFYAGTRAILVSMWPVETTSARKLTTELFRYQQENKALSRAKALQKSILSLIDGPGLIDDTRDEVVASYAHPLFWAPFIIVGDSGIHAD